MSKPDFKTLYAEACAADDAYELAIKRQFGPRATRWTIAKFAADRHGAEVARTREAKYKADNAMRRFIRTGKAVRGVGA